MNPLSPSLLGLPILFWILSPLLAAIVIGTLLRAAGLRRLVPFVALAGSLASIGLLLAWNSANLWHYASRLLAREELGLGEYAAIAILLLAVLIGSFVVWGFAADVVKSRRGTLRDRE